MSTHPNAILLAVLTPNDLARKTWRAILGDATVTDNTDIEIAGENYHTTVLEDDYDQGWQIGAKEGDILVFDLVTYGYGEKIEWDVLAARKQALEAWARDVCERHSCAVKFYVTANFW